MANDYNASVVISTAESERGIRSLDTAAKDLDKTLQNLHKSLQGAQGNLDKVSRSMTVLARNNAALIKSEQDRAKATVIAAKADGQVIVNQSKRQKTANDMAIAEAKAAKIRQSSMASGLSASASSTRRDAEAQARIAATQAVTQARVASEMTRGATAQVNLAAATTRAGSAADMAAARTARLADSSQKAASGTLALNDSLSNSRYLLYDVGQTYTVLAAALQVIPVATAAVAIAYEKDFAQVIRTNDTLAQGNGFSQLREDLKQLATEIPLTFSEFSNIATIGGQLGIAGDSVSSFTETVAKFGAASNVSLDQAATAFGRLQNSYDPMREDPDFFNKIGSAIAYVGVKSAATETEIIAVNNQISAAGAQFGFAADEIVGLSGALASVRIRPELARGAFQRIMLGLSRAADEGSESFNKFGKYTGLAAEESQALFKSDPSAFFYKYIGGIKGAIKETGSVSSVLDDIGAKNVFDKQFILGLSNGYDVFGQSLKNASTSFNEGTFLNESTQGIFETMDAKIKRIGASFQNFADTIGKGSLGGLSQVADTLLSVVNAADRFAEAVPGFTAFLNILMGLGSVIGILLAFKAAQAFALAGLVGFQQVLGKGTLAAGLTAKGIIQQVAVTMLMAKGVSQAHAQALVVQAGAFKAMGVAASGAAVQVTAASLAAGRIVPAAGAATSKLGALTAGLGAFSRGALGLVGGPIGALILGLGAIGLGFVQAEEKAASAGDAIARAMKNGADAGKRAIGDALTERTVDSWITDVGSGGTGNHGKNVRKLAEEVGISFDDIVNSISKGEDASKSFGTVLDTYSKNKGFKDFADLQAKSLTNMSNKKGELQFLSEVVKELGDKSAESAKDVKAVEGVVAEAGDTSANAAPNVDGIAAAIEGAGDESETSAQKLDKFLGAIFGIVDAAGATEAALQNLGEGLANSSDFGPGSEGGRENVDNFREALKAAALEQQMLIDSTGKSTQQASADYIAFVEGLVAEMTARGVDPTNIQIMADQAKTYFNNAMASGDQAQIKLNGQQAIDEARATYATVKQEAAGLDVSLKVKADGTEAVSEVAGVESYTSQVTSDPYNFFLSAHTASAVESAGLAGGYMRDVTGAPYSATINANTSPAIAALQALQSFAASVLTAIQWAINGMNGAVKSAASAEIGNVKRGAAATASPARTVSAPVMPKIAAPAQISAAPAAPNFGSLAGGYDKVRDAANKAGDAGKQAGNDMADGIDDASRAADDYANRLKTGLTSAFDAQYGLQKATDDYHSALNAMAKKRDDELQQIDDLITAQKELNDARKEEQINARKAGIEKDISLKYGEVDRAADYAQQEEEALNAAEAKGKDIAANNAQIISLRAGIGELNGYTDAAIANREAIRNLETKMLDMIVAYAATGASVEQVRGYAQRLTAQFQTDVAQIWHNRVATSALTGEMQRYLDVVNRVPYHKPTTVTADTGQATGALNSLNGLADWATRPREIPIGLNAQAYDRKMRSIQAQIVGGGMADDPSLTAFRPGTFRPIEGYFMGGEVQGFSGGGMVPGRAPANLNHDNMLAKVDGKGLVGIQSEEFIMKKRAVDFWGSDFMHSINNMQMPGFSGGGSAGGRSSGSSSNGPVLVELTAENIAAIQRLPNINLYADSTKIATSVNDGNLILASQGAN